MKLLAVTPWPFIPAMSGGTERCLNLLRGVGEVTAIALDWSGNETPARTQYGEIDYRVLPADENARAQAKLLMANGLHSYDAIPTLTHRNLISVKQAIREVNADLVILEHPWLIDLIGDVPFVYDMHNYETKHSRNSFGANTLDYGVIANIEARAIRQAKHITYCSADDWSDMCREVKHSTPGTHIPNGAPAMPPAPGTSRNLLFIGSLYQPNITAARNLIELAAQLPEYTIQIVGPCSTAITSGAPNVQLFGTVSDEVRDQLFHEAHQFVNLIDNGSGTHLKIARALANGLPVITTAIGARGYDGLNITTMANAAETIRQVTANYAQAQAVALEQGKRYRWENIRKQFSEVVDEALFSG